MNTKCTLSGQSRLWLLFGLLFCAATTTLSAQHCVIQPNINSQGASCFGGNDGSASLAPTGGVAPYTYSWSTGSTSGSISGLSAGNYAYTITDANNCSNSGNVYVGQSAKLLGNLTKTDNTCHGDATGSATLNPSGGTPPYTYSWSNGAATQTARDLNAGAISYTVTDSRGCTGTGSVSILEPGPVWTTFMQRYACNGMDNGRVEVFANGGTPPYTYAWSTGATGSVVENLGPGMYGYTVTDSRGCQDIGLACIFRSPEPDNIVLTSTPPDCGNTAGGSASATVEGGYDPFTYAWSNGATSANITGLTPGTYTLTITDAGGCTYTSSTTVANGATVNLTVMVQNNGNLTANPTGGSGTYTYAWSNGETTRTAINYNNGDSYSVTVTDSNGCTATANGINTGGTMDCTGNAAVEVSVQDLLNGSLRANPSGGDGNYSYAWNNGETTRTATTYQPGDSWRVTVTDGNGCTDTANGQLDPEDDCPGNVTFAGMIGPDQYLCAPGNTPERIGELQAPSGGEGTLEYLWMFSTQSAIFNEGFYTPIPNSNSATYQPGVLDETTYFVRCVRREGCVYLETNPVTITVGNEIDPTITHPPVGCFGETHTYSVTNAPGRVTWTFDGPVTTNVTQGRNIQVTFIGAGDLFYTVTIETDDCTGVFTGRVAVNSCFGGGGEGTIGAPNGGLTQGMQAMAAPNPVSDQTTIDFGQELSSPVLVQLVDVNGAVVQSHQLGAYARRFDLSLSDHVAGLYFVRIVQGDELVQTMRIIKN